MAHATLPADQPPTVQVIVVTTTSSGTYGHQYNNRQLMWVSLLSGCQK